MGKMRKILISGDLERNIIGQALREEILMGIFDKLFYPPMKYIHTCFFINLDLLCIFLVFLWYFG